MTVTFKLPIMPMQTDLIGEKIEDGGLRLVSAEDGGLRLVSAFLILLAHERSLNAFLLVLFAQKN